MGEEWAVPGSDPKSDEDDKDVGPAHVKHPSSVGNRRRRRVGPTWTFLLAALAKPINK